MKERESERYYALNGVLAAVDAAYFVLKQMR